jgi:hypothetical protein
MRYSEVKQLVYDTALDLSKRGPGWAQERAVLHEVGTKLESRKSSEMQQLILTCWHDLFLKGKLSWGLNLDNPNAPFFHVPPADEEREAELAEAGAS